MKTTKIIFRVLVCCLIFLYAQDSAAQFAANERSINGGVYIYSGNTIKNKKNHLTSPNRCTSKEIREIESYEKIFDKVFSEERKKELNDVRFDLMVCCDSSGSILEVNFSMGEHLSKITLEEVYLLEKLFLDYKFEIKNPCPDQKYYMFEISYPHYKKKSERSINGQVYIYSGSTIQNKKNHLESELHCMAFGSLREIKPVSQIYDKVFSEERIKEFNGKRFTVRLHSDSSGNILEVSFYLRDFSMITLEEVYLLEKLFLEEYKVEIRNTCPDLKYYRFTVGGPYRTKKSS